MNSFLPLLMTNINATNISHNILQWAMEPYFRIIGPWALPLIFFLPTLFMFTNIPTNKLLVIAGYMLIVGYIFFPILDPAVALFGQFITTLATAPLLYYGLFKKEQVY